jgi:hypothetical protein
MSAPRTRPQSHSRAKVDTRCCVGYAPVHVPVPGSHSCLSVSPLALQGNAAILALDPDIDVLGCIRSAAVDRSATSQALAAR